MLNIFLHCVFQSSQSSYGEGYYDDLPRQVGAEVPCHRSPGGMQGIIGFKTYIIRLQNLGS